MRLGSRAMLIALLLCQPSVLRAAEPAKPPDALPKPSPRDGDPVEGMKNLPPFFGLFGSADMIAKFGFRSKPGSYIEYRLEASSSEKMRIAEVGPAVPGARWIEITAVVPQMDGAQGMRFLARGEKNGNIERFIMRVMGMPPMELPMEAVGAGAGTGTGVAAITAHMLGPAKSVGHEKVKTPVGTFATEHFVIETGEKGKRTELWVTKDERVPFVGIVKMITPQGTAVAWKIGTDAQAQIPVPQSGG